MCVCVCVCVRACTDLDIRAPNQSFQKLFFITNFFKHKTSTYENTNSKKMIKIIRQLQYKYENI